MFQQLLLTILLWQTPSFVDQAISSANETILKEPKSPAGYNDLALALVRKERETGNAKFLLQAETAIQNSLSLEPANFDGRRARVTLRLRQRRYDDALEEAEALRKQRPDDNPIYAFIAEADLALGKYSGAEKAVQRMLDLRSVNSPGFEAGAMVREMIGYPDGAIEWWTSALHLVTERDHEERAHILTNMSRVYRETGKYPQAIDAAQHALSLEPGYPDALVALARIRLDQHDSKGAGELLSARLKEGNNLESLYWLTIANGATGEFEKVARAQISSPSNESALLVRYLADHGQAEEAIGIADESLQRRRDVFTLHAYALALERAGRYSGALAAIQEALQAGFLEGGLYFDAARFAIGNHRDELAKSYLRKSFELNSTGPNSSEVLRLLASLDKAFSK